MVEDLKAEIVIVDRSVNGGPKGPEMGTVLAAVYKDVLEDDGRVVPGKKGAFICLIYETQGGSLLQCGKNAVRRPEDGEIERLKEAESAAAAELDTIKESFWSGGGRVVYTK